MRGAAQAALADLLAPSRERGARWSVELRDVPVAGREGAGAGAEQAGAEERVLASHRPADLLPTASVAKIFLLIEAAARLADGRLDGDAMLPRDAVPPVADSGLWQHLDAPALSARDVAALIGAVSDNLATNVLLETVGLAAVDARARSLAPGGSALLDRVRDRRGPADPPMLSRGCAADWARIMARLGQGSVVDRAVSERVLRWLARGTDLSMVAGAFGVDPLAHAEPDRGMHVVSKTGTDAGIRADVGLVRWMDAPREAPGGGEAAACGVAYAAICVWDEDEAATTGETLRDEVLAAIRGIGALIRTRIGERVAGR